MHSIYKIAASLIGSVICLGCLAATPSDLLTAGYAVYEADVNSDGCKDYLIKAKDRLVMLDLDDLVMPIPAPSPNKPFILQSSPGCQYVLVQPIAIQQVQDSRWVKAQYAAVAGDVAGGGKGSLLILPTDSTSSYVFNVVRNASAQFSLLQTINALDFKIGLPGNVSVLRDADADGRSDIVISNGNNIVALYSAQTDGKFSLSSLDNNSGAATLVWNAFLVQLKAGSTNAALDYISAQTREKFRSVLTSSGGANFANSVKDFAIISVTAQTSTAAIVVEVAGVSTMYFVTFGKENEGEWKIYMM